jgi:beta-galactosidase
MDPSRPTIQAQNELADDRIMQLTDVQGRNRYFGWYSGGAKYLNSTSYTKILDALLLDKANHPDWKLVVSEYGAEGKLGYHVRFPRRFDHSETYQIQFHQYYWKVIDSLPWVAGGYIWNMFDFASWAKIGNVPHINQKGTMTYDRKPKSLYYLYQSRWSSKPMVYLYPHTQPSLAVVNEEPVRIEVFSNCKEVRLYVDNKAQGTGTKQGNSFLWHVALPPGRYTLTAVGSSDWGEVVKDQKIVYTYGRTETEEERKRASQGSDSD